MPNSWHKEIIESITIYGALWGFGGFVMYLNKVRKWTKFKVSMFLINIILAGWLWIIAQAFIIVSNPDIQYALVSIIWFLAFPILDFLEDNWLKLLINRFLWPNK